ncbi:PEP-CTERM sorting domain-containing protein [Leptolyngbya sp. PCC 6406]|uniref:PEP-CTERM sorting domain-containing protein n=1 Tax=Leptolyngbya sp. PCC 6406 TaxID=1173264 RepID=UPI0002ABB439|nr:PEP-CTERM sorting domain-containing protein [Leptolyngbya sp. PCC 6406]
MKTIAALLGTSVLTASIVSLSAMSASAATLLGTFSGNDTGATGTAITNLNTLAAPGPWSLVGKSDEGFGTFLSGGTTTKDGIWSTGLTGAGAFSVKAANSYTLYLTDDISVINWSTVGITNQGGQQPTLSHLSLYTRDYTPEVSVPEPMMILGSVVAAGTGLALKRRNG